MALELIINGKNQTFEGLAPGVNLKALLAELGLQPDRIAIELNGEIEARRGWDEVALSMGDRLEVVHFVGGGASN